MTTFVFFNQTREYFVTAPCYARAVEIFTNGQTGQTAQKEVARRPLADHTPGFDVREEEED